MEKAELLHELDRIIDVGIVNAKHDKAVLEDCRETLQESSLDDQWKSGGRCSHCRRTNYCKTQCSANKRAIQEVYIKKMRNKLGLEQIREAIKELGGEVKEA